MEFLIVLAVGCCLFGCFGAWVACQKNRGFDEGLALGLLFGPFGVLIEALLPSLPTPASQPSLDKQASAAAADAYAAKARREADDIAMQQARAAWLDKQALAAADAAANAKARREAQHAALREKGIEPGPMAWFKVLPDWIQAVLMGAGLSFLVLSVVAAISLARREPVQIQKPLDPLPVDRPSVP